MKKITLDSLFLEGRLDIILLYLVIVWSYLDAYGSFLSFSQKILAMFTLSTIVFGAYIGNKLYDQTEDSFYGAKSTIGKYKDRLLIFIVLVAVLPYFFAQVVGEVTEPYITAYFIGILFAFFYSFPIFGFRIKKVFLIKNVFAASAWFLSVVILLTLYLNKEPLWTNIGDQAYLFFIFLAYEILWDIKDIDGDKHVGTKTLPNTLGVGVTKAIVGVLMFVVFFLVEFDITTLGFITGLYVLLWAAIFSPDSSLRYYHFMILGQSLIILIHMFLR